MEGQPPPRPKVLASPAACASDHLPISVRLDLRIPIQKAKSVFLPTPRRMESVVADEARQLYRAELPRLASLLRAAGTRLAFHAHVEEMHSIIRVPWMKKVKPKPRRHSPQWSATADSLAKARSSYVKRAMGKNGTAADWLEKRRLDREIKRLVRAKAHLLRQVAVDNLRKNASSLSLADVAARVRKISATSKDADKLGDELIPRDFTKFFVDKPKPKSSVKLRKFTLPREMENIFAMAIRSAKKGKAAGPDGVPMELLKLCPLDFAELLFELFAAGGRLQCVMKDWDFSLLIPIYKGKGPASVPANNRPLRLILIIRKIYEMGTTVRLVRERPDDLEQHGFAEKAMALTPVALVVSAASLHYVLTFLLDLVKAYDLVQREQIMQIVDEEHSAETAAMVATLLQPSKVMTKGDETKLVADIDVGVIQGGPASPPLFNKVGNVVIRRTLHALKVVDDGRSPPPIKSFADDIALQLASGIAAAIALRAAGMWARLGLLEFNVGVGKSLQVLDYGTCMSAQRSLGGETIRGSHEATYLGIGIAARGATPRKVETRVGGACATLFRLTQTKALVRGMDMSVAVMVHRAFVESKWTYGCFFSVLQTPLLRKIDSMDAAFITATLVAVAAKSKQKTLTLGRALLRMDSPELVRKIKAHQFVAQLVRTSSDSNAPQHARDRARLARRDLHSVPHLRDLVDELDRPWGREEIRAAREEEWKNAFRRRKRKPPTAGRKYETLPWGLRLLPPWTRPLVARYFFATFPILEKKEEENGKTAYSPAAKTAAETLALRSLRLLQSEWTGVQADIDEVVSALETLRCRGCRGKGAEF